MALLYGGEEGDASYHPCNRDEVRLSNRHHADKEQGGQPSTVAYTSFYYLVLGWHASASSSYEYEYL